MKWRKRNSYFLISLHIVVVSSFYGCNNNNVKIIQETEDAIKTNLLDSIRHKKVLKVAVDYNSTDYFVYRGQPMGFQYEILQDLAKDLDVQLDIKIDSKLDSTFIKLQKGEYDLVAQNLTVTLKRKDQIDFITPLGNIKQILVQRKRSFSSDSLFVKDLLDLENKTISVQKNSAYSDRLKNIQEEIGAQINVVEHPYAQVSELIEAVAKNKIDYTICDDNLARMNKIFYPNLNFNVEISFPQNFAWAVNKDNEELKNYLDNWINEYKRTRKFRNLYDKYYVSLRAVRNMGRDYKNLANKKISNYDEIIKKYAKAYGWDWRLIASIINAESNFDHEVVSWGGAVGLMQLMPETAKSLGYEDLTDPEQNIRAGIQYLTQLDKLLQPTIQDSTERVKFVLAAYNVGLGHLQDAQRLAEKYGKDKTKWNKNVGYYMKRKIDKKFYRDPVVKWGYIRGDLAYRYVNEVLHDYEVYKDFIPE